MAHECTKFYISIMILCYQKPVVFTDSKLGPVGFGVRKSTPLISYVCSIFLDYEKDVRKNTYDSTKEKSKVPSERN